MKIFKGYLALGVASKQEAKDKTGLLIWCRSKPTKFRLYLLEKLLGIYWIKEYKELHKKDRLPKTEEIQIIK